jgi:transposase-like protein
MSPIQEVRMKPRKNYPKEFKARVALEAIREQKTIAELSSEYEVHSTLIARWKKDALDNMSGIFAKKNEREPSDKELIENLYKQIGQSQVEINWLKKKLGF